MAKAKKKQQDTDLHEEIAETAAEFEAQAEDDADLEDDADATEETAEDQPEDVAAESFEPAADENGEPLAITAEDVRLVEAILFASSSAVTVSMIAERFPEARVSLIPDVLDLLREQYAARGVTLVQRDNRWALRTASDLGDQLRLEKEQPKKFTRAAMETMAIIAYHQPVTRAEIENIRGVATSPGALDALMEAGWIKPGKRREVPGRPVTWLTTQAFLDHFGLEKLEDLPGMDELKAAGLLDKRPAIEAMPTADLFGDDEGKNDADLNEITDEDLLGKPESDTDDQDDRDEDRAAFSETASVDGGEDDDSDEDDEDLDDEESDDEDDADEDDGDDLDDEDSDDDGEADDSDDEGEDDLDEDESDDDEDDEDEEDEEEDDK